MTRNNSLNRLANISRRKVLATTMMYAISLTVRSTSATGKETEVSTSPTQRIDPMTTVTTKDGVQIFCNDGGAEVCPAYCLSPWLAAELRRLGDSDALFRRQRLSSPMIAAGTVARAR